MYTSNTFLISSQAILFISLYMRLGSYGTVDRNTSLQCTLAESKRVINKLLCKPF